MGKRGFNSKLQNLKTSQPRRISSLLDEMEDGREYASLIALKNVTVNINLADELKRAIEDIQNIRKRPAICYMANVVNPRVNASISIDNSDDLPFSEMLDSIDREEKNLDIILVTPGGSAELVANLVEKIRNRFSSVGFILPYMAMSAGTIFCMSADELIMTKDSFFGPIDPQIPSKDGRYAPAQSLLTLLSNIQQRGEEQLAAGQPPFWVDQVILNNLDALTLGNVYNASKLSTKMVTNYLQKYKFKSWENHSDGRNVSVNEKKQRASEIAVKLCDHSIWLSHSNRISRQQAEDVCKLQILKPETINGFDRAIRRLWALTCFVFERDVISKIYIASNYSLFRKTKFEDRR